MSASWRRNDEVLAISTGADPANFVSRFHVLLMTATRPPARVPRTAPTQAPPPVRGATDRVSERLLVTTETRFDIAGEQPGPQPAGHLPARMLRPTHHPIGERSRAAGERLGLNQLANQSPWPGMSTPPIWPGRGRQVGALPAQLGSKLTAGVSPPPSGCDACQRRSRTS